MCMIKNLCVYVYIKNYNKKNTLKLRIKHLNKNYLKIKAEIVLLL